VSVPSTVVTGFVPGGLGALRRDVSHFTAVEATAVLRSRLVDDGTFFPFQTGVGTLTRNVSSLATVVTGLVAGCGSSPASAATESPASRGGRAWRRRSLGVRIDNGGFRHECDAMRVGGAMTMSGLRQKMRTRIGCKRTGVWKGTLQAIADRANFVSQTLAQRST
jgi:hypothetical protein